MKKIITAAIPLIAIFTGLLLVDDNPPEPLKQQESATQNRIDSLQGLTKDRKAYALKRLEAMGPDSVEAIIKQAGF